MSIPGANSHPPTVYPPKNFNKAGGLKHSLSSNKAEALGVYTSSTALANVKRAPLCACDNSRTVCNYRQSLCQRNQALFNPCINITRIQILA